MKFDSLDQISLTNLKELKNWQDKYRTLIQWGKLISKKETIRYDEFLIHGCEIPVWLACKIDKEGRYRFAFDSDSKVMNGLVAVILSLVDRRTKEDILSLPLEKILSEAGLQKHLTQSRTNGYVRIVHQLKSYL